MAAIADLTAKRNSILYAFILSGVSLLILIAFLIYNHSRIKKEARLQVEINRQQDLAGKAVIEAEEKERRRIAGDLHGIRFNFFI